MYKSRTERVPYPVRIMNFEIITATPCNLREAEYGYVCVCNSTYCDTLPQLDELSSGLEWIIHHITVDRSTTYQNILGYGGAFTDSTGINIAALSDASQEYLLKSYFSEEGSEYTFGRVPVGGADFSTRGYTYDDGGNGTLDGFALEYEDYDYKIPYIIWANNLTGGNLKLVASAWSAPAWMKDSNDIIYGFLLEEYYQLWADYYIKFFEAYQENGIDFWGVTTQNEPGTGLIEEVAKDGINSMAWYSWQLIQWLKENLGPTIRNSSFPDLKILIHDDQSTSLPTVQEYFTDAEALNYLDGVAVHWYADVLTLDAIFASAQTDKKDTFVLMTEACSGYTTGDVQLGSWDRGVDYIKSIIRLTNLNYAGWIDWNMALDLEGGPNWVENYVDSPIIVNATADEFYKQPMYYALAQVSKYVPPGSVRIDNSVSLLASTLGVQSTSFLRPDGAVATIIYNPDDSRDIVLYDEAVGYTTLSLTSNSINTIVYN
ncbi:glucosylceramidase [Rhyzopertha dominica]|nr:glucosylceramidase [Rhyzopertha dominica]